MWTWNIIGTGERSCVDVDSLQIHDRVILRECIYKDFLDKCKDVYGLTYAKSWESRREDTFFIITARERCADGPTVYTIEPANLHECFPAIAFMLNLRVFGLAFEWGVTEDDEYLRL